VCWRPPRGPLSRPVTPAETVLAYIDALNAHDADGVAALVTADFWNEHTSSMGTSVRGRRAYRERLDGFLAAFVDLRYVVEDVIAEGSKVAVPYSMTAVMDGAPIEVRGMFRFEVRDGAIAHRVDYWDSAGLPR
jgi:steroid delta-isomerase-like uncharacterized protein